MIGLEASRHPRLFALAIASVFLLALGLVFFRIHVHIQRGDKVPRWQTRLYDAVVNNIVAIALGVVTGLTAFALAFKPPGAIPLTVAQARQPDTSVIPRSVGHDTTATRHAPLVIPGVGHGYHGTVFLSQGQLFAYRWATGEDPQRAKPCEFRTSRTTLTSGIPASGYGWPIGVGDPFYPVIGGNTSFVVTCETAAHTFPSDTAAVAISTTGIVNHAPAFVAKTDARCGGVVDLSWQAIDGEDSYYVFRDGELIATVRDTVFLDIDWSRPLRPRSYSFAGVDTPKSHSPQVPNPIDPRVQVEIFVAAIDVRPSGRCPGQ